MSRKVLVHLLPTLFQPEDLEGGTAVVIDILRASTTIIHALGAGALEVIPCGEVEEARSIAANHSADAVRLGGEREGRRIPGFDLDNSPLAYTSSTIGGKTLVFSTTNGTRALARTDRAARVLIGGFVNLHAVLALLLEDSRPIHLVCAGTDGAIAKEDVLFAGAVVRGLALASREPLDLPDTSDLALAYFDTHNRTWDDFLRALRTSRGGRNLIDLGFDADIDRAGEWDLFDVVPELCRETRRIQAATVHRPIQERWLVPPA